MKAQHRHELHTNALASYLGKSLDKAKSGSGVIWGGLLLIVALGIAYWWWTGVSADRTSDAWTSYYNNRDSVEGLEGMATRLKGTSAEKAAKLALADQLFDEGYKQFFRKSPKSAQELFTKAFAAYEELSKSAGGTEMGLRAVMGAAKCQESIGEVERAKYFYEEAVARFGKPLTTKSGQRHPLVEEAERRTRQLKDGAGLAFYGTGSEKRWPHRLPVIEHEPPKTPLIPSGGALTKPSGP